jgi:4a-hydroxytetrahydrobiopterin dehydratase
MQIRGIDPITMLLTETAIQTHLTQLPGWAHTQDRIEKKFRFKNFSQAFAFMTQVALIAERLDHHPNWSNVYNEVHLALYTHSQGGVTALDIQFALAVENLL